MKIYYKIQLIYLLFLGLFMTNTASASSSEEPVYYLKFSAKNAALEVRLNDIPVLSHSANGTTSSEKPVPENIIDGINTITATLTPLRDEEDLFSGPGEKGAEISLVVRDKSAPLSEYVPVIHIKLTPGDDKDVIFDGTDAATGLSPPILIKSAKDKLVAERAAAIDSPYPRWAWQDGAPIEDTPENFSSLFEEYRKIYEVLKSGDMDRIKAAYSNAAHEFAAAYHYADKAEGHRIIGTGSFVGDSDWILGDVQNLLNKGVEMKLDIYANGRLARIVDAKGEDIVIMYLNRSARMISVQKYGFYMTNEGRWIMIR